MLDDAFGHAKLGETRTELQRLRCEIAAWHTHRIAKDTQQQYATPLKVLNELFTKALADIESAAGGDTADAAASWADSRRLDRALVWVRRLWNFFGSRFDQRDGDTPAAALLKAADEMVWSCYIEPFRLTGRSMTANNTLERTVNHRGRTVRAVALCARAGAQWRQWSAVQRDR